MADIIHRIGIKAKADKVYGALSTTKGVSSWWTEETAGNSKVGDALSFAFHSKEGELLGEMKADVKELKPNQRVQWRVTEGPDEWIDTDITFDLSEQDGMTIVLFGHRNWKRPVEFMGHCSMKWATFLLSLRDLVEKGKGKPSPNDLKIDNWN